MHLDHIKATLKALGAKSLTLKYDKPLSNSAFNFNLRRYAGGSICIPGRKYQAGPDATPSMTVCS
jgi:hypothetical protein